MSTRFASLAAAAIAAGGLAVLLYRYRNMVVMATAPTHSPPPEPAGCKAPKEKVPIKVTLESDQLEFLERLIAVRAPH